MKEVFQLLGQFCWPPDGTPHQNVIRGVVEIGYSDASPSQAVIRWTPTHAKGRTPWHTNPADPGDGSTPCILDPTRNWAFIGGVMLVQQDAEQPLRWPLVREVKVRGVVHRSGLFVDAAKKQFRFDLILPAITPQIAEIREGPNVASLSATFRMACPPASVGELEALEYPGVIRGGDPTQNQNEYDLNPDDRPRIAKRLDDLRLAIDSKEADGKKTWWLPKTVQRRQLTQLHPIGLSQNTLEPFRIAGLSLEGLGQRDILTSGERHDGIDHLIPDQDQFSIRFGPNGYRQRIAFRPKESKTVSGSDIEIRNRRFRFRDKTNPWGWIATGLKDDENGRDVFINLHADWIVGKDPVDTWLRGDPLAVDLGVRAELCWVTTEKPAEQPQQHPDTERPVFDHGGLGDLIRFLGRQTFDALGVIVPEQPQSTLPSLGSIKKLENLENLDCWYCAETRRQSLALSAGDAPPPVADVLDLAITHLSLASKDQLAPNRRALASKSDNSVKLGIRFEHWVVREGGASTDTEFAIRVARAEPDYSSDAFASFSIFPDSRNTVDIRLGAFKFRTAPSWLAGDGVEAPSRVSLFARPPAADDSLQSRLGVRFDWRFQLSEVWPVTVDVARGDRDRADRPLLIREKAPVSIDPSRGAAATDVPRFTLQVSESIHPGATDWLLRAALQDLSKDQTPGSTTYTVLSAEPFSLFRFHRLPLEQSGDAETNIIATFDSDTRQWRLLRRSPHYRFILPAQAIGEASDKPGRLELHDRPNGAAMDPTKTGPDGVLQSYVVEWRLTTPTDLWVKPGDFDRNYFLPEWAAHDIFRQRSDLGIGAPLTGFCGEFLYGLTVGIDPSLETGPAREARVAEVEALTGFLPRAEVTLAPDSSASNPTGDGNPSTRLGDRWKLLRPALKRRQERLELWNDRPDQPNRLALARFSKGVRFALRQTALHRTPVSPPPEPSPPANQKDPEVRHHAQGLPGGALWPLESWNAFHRLVEDPVSRGGHIERIALGPTGGDADQKAEFLGGILSIVSETRGGYVQHQRIEVLGRIGALWHRAKHVIIYERTVNPSAQFAKEGGNGTRTRRPVIRKVREYVEILQFRRDFPDFDAPARASGFLRAVQFNSRQIAVDSAWGRDLDDFGYEIPLWNRHAATVRPQVYPKPDVVFLSAGESESDDVLNAQQCLDPDNLFFVADFSNKNPDSDTWTSRLGVDTARSLEPAELVAIAAKKEDASGSRSNRDARLTATSRFFPGLRRFTWRLGTGAGKSRINAERGEEPLFAGVDSVTFLRAMPDVEKSQEDTLRELFEVLNNPITIDANHWVAGSAGPGGVGGVADLANHLVLLKKAIAEQGTPKWAEAETQAKAIVAQLTESQSSLHKQVARAHDAVDTLRKKLDPIGKWFADEPIPCESFKSRIVADLKRPRMAIEQNLRLVHGDIAEALKGPIWTTPIPNPAAFVAAVIGQLVTGARQHVEPLFEQARRSTDEPREQVAKIRAIVADHIDDLATILRRAQRRLDAQYQAYQDDKPWSEQRMKAFDAKLAGERAAIQGELSSAIDEAQQRLATELNGASSTLAAAVSKALELAVARHVAISQGLTDTHAIREQILDRARAPLARSITAMDQLIPRLDRWINDAAVPQPEKDKLHNIRQLVVGMRKLLRDREQEIATLANLGDDAYATMQQTVDVLLRGIRTLARDGADSIQQAKADLDQLSAAIQEDLHGLVAEAGATIDAWTKASLAWAQSEVNRLGDLVAPGVTALHARLDDSLDRISLVARDTGQEIDVWLEFVEGKLGEFENILDEKRFAVLLEKVLKKGWEQCANRWPIDLIQNAIDDAANARDALANLIQDDLDTVMASMLGVGGYLDAITSSAIDIGDQAKAACDWLSDAKKRAWRQVDEFAQNMRTRFNDLVEHEVFDVLKAIKDRNLTDAVAAIQQLEEPLRIAANQIADAGDNARAVARRLVEAAGSLGKGGAEAVPGNLMRLYGAATQAPEIAMLEANRDRIQCAFDQARDLIQTSGMQVHFQRLGDALKAIGLNLDVNGLSNQLALDVDRLKKIDIAGFFRNFGGINLDGLLSGVKLSDKVLEAIKVSHAFDRKKLRAWVRIDIDVPVSGRRELFSIGPFTMYFRDSRLTGRLHYEASADSPEIAESGHSEIVTSIEAVVGGQVMVTLEQVAIRHSAAKGLDVDFDPARIRLNEVFRFIQDTLGALFPDEVGGLRLIKEQGIPVGVEHLFSLPPMALSFGTSGVSNIQIMNQFRLLAYPDFVIANRFNLSTVEQPFIFSIFILGGTGYLQVDTEYRPIEKALTVVVEAAAGASAALAFAFGPVQGSVYITLSVALSYRRISNNPGALSVSLVLVIAGNVSLWGMVRIFLVLMLRLNYHGNGALDAHGSLSVEVRVSRWFKLRYRTNVTYKLRDGKSTTTRQESLDYEPGEELVGLQKKAEKLAKARG